MRYTKILASLVGLLFAASVSAACTWSTNGSLAWKVVCTTGTEALPTLATEGVPCQDLKKITIRAEADSGQTFTATPAGTLRVAVYNARSTVAWARCPDCGEPQITEASVRVQSFSPWAVACREGDRIAFYPNAVTLSAGSLTVYVDGYL